MSTKRTCPACNEEVMQGDEYCASCGASLSGFWMRTWTSPPPRDSSAIGDQEFIPLQVPQLTERKRHRSRSRIVLIVTAILLLTGILATTYILTREDDEQEPQSSASGSTTLETSLTEVADLTGGVIVPVAERFEPTPTPHTGTTSGSASAHPQVASSVEGSPSFTGFLGPSRDARIVEVVIETIRDEDGRDHTGTGPLP